jgi:diguanylate cyclase (GGDEF)-like protein/PAS domain S-box-containing protein
MQAFENPGDEPIRIHAALPSSACASVLNERLESLTRLARHRVGVTAALITIASEGRQQFAACDGFAFEEIPFDLSVCDYADVCDDILVVPDTVTDERFRNHALASENPTLRFYAGRALTDSRGTKIGTFSLLHSEPRELDDEEREFLRDVAYWAAAVVERDNVHTLERDEQPLRDSERRMALAIAGSGTGIWDRDVQKNEIHYSAGWKAILGYSDSELTSRIMDSYSRVHPDDLAYVQATIQAHFDQKTPSYDVEHRIRCKDGSYKWISSRGKVVSRDREGKPLRMIGTTTDVTAMRAMSERLQQTVDLITNLTNEVPGLVFQYRLLPNGESFFPYASGGIKDIYEFTPAQVATSAAAIDEIIHPDDLAAYRASLDASAASLAPWDLEYRVQLPRQGLRWRQGHARPRRLEDNSTLWHGFITDVTERKRIETELQGFATIDFMTQLPNRRHFIARLEAQLAQLKLSTDRSAAVLMCDLDHFKSINDRWGHAVGDLALRHFATILDDQLRKDDTAGRMGGEEFAIVLPGAGVAEAVTFSRRLQQRLMEMPLIEGDYPIYLTVSIGVTALEPTDPSVESSLSRSDMALYRAKGGGRNRIDCE